MKHTRNPDSWPAWLQPLRPDPLTRERLRRRIVAEAAAVLRAREAGSWLSVADRWTTLLLPLAAALALTFAALAQRASAPVELAERPPTVEQLLQPSQLDGPPALLIAATEPGIDDILSAAVAREDPNE